MINDDSQSPQLVVNDISANEGNAGTTPLTLTVSLIPASDQTVTVQWSTEDGTATTADNDYQAASGTLTLRRVQQTGRVPLQVVGDTRPEDNETLR